MGKTGRPTTYTEEKATAICQAVAGGETVTQAAKDAGVPSTTLFRWLNERPAFWEQYTRARQARGEHYGAKVTAVAKKCEAGDIDPNAARVAMDGYKWAAARMAPKSWGDKQQHEHTGEAGQAIQFVIREAPKPKGEDKA